MNKRIIMILFTLLISFGIIGIYHTFAFNAVINENDENIYDVSLTDNSTISVPAKSSKIVYYRICNTNKGKLKYGVGYNSDNITVKTYYDTIDPDTGYIDYGENKFVKLKLINDTAIDDTITLSTVLGYEYGGELISPSGVTLITKKVSDNTKIDTETDISSSSSSFLGTTEVTRSQINSISFESDNIVPTGALYPKDISATNDGSIMMWYTQNSDGSYKLHMGSENGKISITNGKKLFAYMENLESIDFTNVDLSELTSMDNMFRECTSLSEIKFGHSEISNITNMDHTFYKTNLTSINLSNLDTSKVTTMRSLFAYSPAEYLDLRSFNTSSVTTMYGMFHDCYNLKGVNLSSFDTSNVTDLEMLFYACNNLERLDLSNFDTSNVTTIKNMFYGCQKLVRIDLSNFNTSKITDMGLLFFDCYSLISLDLSSFDTSNVTNMRSMFWGCTNLTSLDLSGFDTSSVTDMSRMFQNCYELTSLNLSSFDTSKVTTFYSMFSDCRQIASLDLSNFDTKNVTIMYSMFRRCFKLNTIYVSQLWDTSKVTDSIDMFLETTLLKGGSGTLYDANYIDKTYAIVDGGASNPGYLTSKTNEA